MKTWHIGTVVITSILLILGISVFTVLSIATERSAPRTDNNFLYVVRPVINGSDTQLIAMGHSVCQDFNNGDERYQITDTLALRKINGTKSAVLIDAAISNYCPQYKGR